MGILIRAIERRETLQNPSRWLTLAFGGGQQTAAGILVNEAIALRSTTVMACVRIISETIAQLPLPIYKRLDSGGKIRAPEHPLWRVLHDQTNSEMTAFDFREILTAHLLTWGNGYAEIERDNADRIIGLWPMLPDRTWPYRDPITGRIVYRTRIKRDPMSVSIDDTVTIQLPEEKVLHIKGLGFDGLKGYSVIQHARELIAQDLALNEFAGRFFGNGAVPGGVLETDKRLNKEQHDRLKTSWQEQHQGLTNAQRVAILEEGLHWKEIGLPLKDAQWIEARKYTRNEITSLYRIPPHMVGDVERSTSWGSGIEQQAIGFLVYTIQPWVVRWEQAMLAKLFTPTERATYFPEFLVDGLVRGDISTRTTSYQSALLNGWMSPNEVRERENMNPYPGGDTYRVQLNTGPAIPEPIHEPAPISPGTTKKPVALTAPSKIKQLPDPADIEPSAASLAMHLELRAGVASAQRHVLAEVFERAARREKADLTRALERRTVEEGAAFVRQFYANHREYVRKALLPAMLGYAEVIQKLVGGELHKELTPASEFWRFVQDYTESAAERFCSAALKVFADHGPAEALGLIDERASRANELAEGEAVRAGNAFALALYRESGEKLKRWVAMDRCPECVAYEGIVRIEERFGPVLHPPFHRGCNCVLLRQGAPVAAPSGSVVLIRHGETEWNQEPQRYRGWRDIPLTAQGKQESDRLARDVCERFKFDRILSSDLRRAQYQAHKISEGCGVPVESVRGLRPWDVGELSGQPVGDGSNLGRYAEHPNEKVPGGESLNDFLERFFSFLKPALTQAAAEGQTVGLVTHTRNVRALLAWTQGDQEGAIDRSTLGGPTDPLEVGTYTLLQHDGKRWVDAGDSANNAPDTPDGAIPGNASKITKVEGPGSLGQPVVGWPAKPPNASMNAKENLMNQADRELLASLQKSIDGLNAVVFQALATRPEVRIEPGAIQVTVPPQEATDLEISGPGGTMRVKRISKKA